MILEKILQVQNLKNLVNLYDLKFERWHDIFTAEMDNERKGNARVVLVKLWYLYVIATVLSFAPLQIC